MKPLSSGGGWPAIKYVLREAKRAGGWLKMWRALRTRNACKTCALGMGGQRGGMVNEAGSFPEFCKKSVQAMASDMQPAISADFWKTYSIAQLQKFTPYDLERVGRLVDPVVLEPGEQYFKVIDWDDALQRIVAKLKTIEPDESFWYFSGRSSNEAGFLLHLFARVWGTNNVNNCSYYCHQASGVGLNQSVGTGTATIQLSDLEHADLVFLIGGNPASNHPRMMSSLAKIRKRGGHVIVINPVRETGLVNFRIPSNPRSLLFGSKIASQYIQPHIGGDLALLIGIAKQVVEDGRHDPEFLSDHCEDAEAWLEGLARAEWAQIERESGVTRDVIKQAAETYGKCQNAVFAWTMGITHHVHGVLNVQAIANLALARRMVGRPHAGLLPIRGHSNVQGIGSVGVTPKLKEEIFQRLQNEYEVKLPTSNGLDTLACIESAHRDEMKLAFCLGGNLFGSNPDARFASDALAKIDQVVYLNTTLNTGHACGVGNETIILPVLARDEEPHPSTQESMFNYVRMSDGGKRRHEGPRSEVEVISALAKDIVGATGPLDFASLSEPRNIRAMIGKVVPGYNAITRIDETKQEFHIEGRTLHDAKFPTLSGRARMHDLRCSQLSIEEDQLRLMTVRSEGQFNTVVYEQHDAYRGQDHRHVVLVNPDDLSRLGLQDEQTVEVVSDVGSMSGLTIRGYSDIRAGNALMYYPEANQIVSREADPQSRTPAFKGTLIRIRAIG